MSYSIRTKKKLKNVETMKTKLGGSGGGGVGGSKQRKAAVSVSPPTERFIKDYSSFDSDSDSLDDNEQRPPRGKKKMKVCVLSPPFC